MDTRWRALAGLAVIVGFMGGCAGSASPSLSPSATTTTAIQGWEYYFRLDWVAEPKADAYDIGGYIYNTYGAPATNVQVLAQSLDAGGNVIGQKLVWVQGGVPPLSRSYFRVAGLPPANAHRVSVWAFDWIQGHAPER
jgi:hypothetical protein